MESRAPNTSLPQPGQHPRVQERRWGWQAFPALCSKGPAADEGLPVCGETRTTPTLPRHSLRTRTRTAGSSRDGLCLTGSGGILTISWSRVLDGGNKRTSWSRV